MNQHHSIIKLVLADGLVAAFDPDRNKIRQGKCKMEQAVAGDMNIMQTNVLEIHPKVNIFISENG